MIPEKLHEIYNIEPTREQLRLSEERYEKTAANSGATIMFGN